MDALFDSYWLTVVVSVVLPIVVALVTKQMASGGVKAVTLLLLSAVTGFFTAWLDQGDAFDWKAGAVAWVLSFVMAVAAHFGLLKPAAVTGQDGAVQKAVTGGIG